MGKSQSQSNDNAVSKIRSYIPTKFSDDEKMEIIWEIQYHKLPDDYRSPRAIKQLITQFLLARSLLQQILNEDKNRIPDMPTIIAAILKLQGLTLKSKSMSTVDDENISDDIIEIIKMVVWEQKQEG